MQDTMPTTYESKTTTSTSGGPGISLQMDYIRTIPGILKIVEMVLSLLVFICSIVGYYKGSGWVEFVSMSAFLTILILFILYLINVYSRLAGPIPLIEFIYFCVFTVFFLIAAIVAAVGTDNYGQTSVGFAAFFAFAATAVFGVDTFFQYRAWRSSPQMTGGATTTTTTTEVTAQY